MTLLQKLQQYGQFGDADMPEIKAILSLAEEVASDRVDIEGLHGCNCGDHCTGTCSYAEAKQLIAKIHALVDGKRRDVIGDLDDLWSAVNFAHGRLDEGEIDEDTAKYECDTAINAYLGRPPCDPEHINSMFPVEQVMAEHLIELPEGYKHLHNHLGKAIDVNESFVTMTVPVSVAMRVADTELMQMGDSHRLACENVEAMLRQDLAEEWGIDSDMAQKYHERVGYYGEVKS